MALLGDFGFPTICTDHPDALIRFYKALSFHAVPFKPAEEIVLLSDGSCLLGITLGKFPSLQFTYFTSSLRECIRQIEKLNIDFDISSDEKKMVIKQLRDVSIVVINHPIPLPVKQNPLTLRSIPPQLLYHPEELPNPQLGIWGESGLTVASLDAAIPLWQAFGYHCTEKHAGPYPWAVMTDTVQTIALHQTRSLKSPLLSYFAPDMKRRSEKLQQDLNLPLQDTGPCYGGLPALLAETPTSLTLYLCTI